MWFKCKDNICLCVSLCKFSFAIVFYCMRYILLFFCTLCTHVKFLYRLLSVLKFVLVLDFHPGYSLATFESSMTVIDFCKMIRLDSKLYTKYVSFCLCNSVKWFETSISYSIPLNLVALVS